MKRVPKTIIILAVLAIIIGGAAAYYMYNKPHKNIAKATPDFIIHASELYDAFEKNDSLAIEKYSNKIIELQGSIDNIQSANDTDFTILIAVDNAPTGNIKCAMDPAYAQHVKNYQSGNQITLKGICIGANKTEDLGLTMLDIEMTRCVVVSK